MPDSRTRSRRITAMATLVVALVFLAGGLYLARVSAQLSYLKSRDFRIAATLAEVAENRLNNVGDVLKSQAKACIEEDQTERCGELLREPPCFEHLGWHADSAVHEHSSDQGANDEEDGKPRTGNGSDEDSAETAHEAGAGTAHHLAGEEGDQHHHSDSGDVADDAPDDGSQALDPAAPHTHLPEGKTEVQVDHATGTIQFLYSPPEGAPEQGELHAKADAECLLSLIEREEVFDDIVVLDSNDQTVFQTGGSGVRIENLSVESAKSGGEGSSGDAAGPVMALPTAISRLQEVKVAGEPYAFFRQPVRLEFKRKGTQEVALWEVVGLVRSDRLLADALRIDPSGLVVLVALLLLGLCAWPFLKLAATGGREGILPREVVWVSASLAVACALLAVATLDLGLNAERRSELDGELKQTAEEIEASLKGEVDAALDQLQQLKDLHGCGRSGEGEVETCVDKGNLFESIASGTLRTTGPAPTVHYPYLRMVYWTDACGNQVAKWAAAGESTPLISVAQRPYFQRALDGDLWSPRDWPGDGPSAPFFLQPIRSWTTGVQEVVLSVALGKRGSAPEKDCRGGGEEGKAVKGHPVAAMASFSLPSMQAPILPPGRGFAVLDDAGRVVFHSRSERNGLEDFVRETEDSPELRGALFARTARHFTAEYRGREHQMYVEPLSGLPWYLVVFERRDVLQTANFEAAMAALLLGLIEIVLLAAAVGLIRLVGRRGSLRSLWPAPDDVSTYGRMITISLLVAGAFGASLAWAPSSASLLRAGFLLPFVALGFLAAAAASRGHRRIARRAAALLVGLASALGLLALEASEAYGGGGGSGAGTVLLVHGVVLAASFALTGRGSGRLFLRRRRGRPAARPWLGSSALFVLASGLTLAVLSALPAACFLQAALRERLDLEARRGQLYLARALLERGAAIEEKFQDLPPLERPRGAASGSEAPWWNLLADGRDVHARGYLGTCFAYEIRGTCTAEDPEAERPECAVVRTGHDACSAGTPAPARIGAWTLFNLPFSNLDSVRSRAVASTTDSDGEDAWEWSRPADGRTDSVVLSGGSPVQNLRVVVSSRVPTTGLPSVRSAESARFLAAGLASLALILSALLFVGRRMFHVEFRVHRPPTLDDLEEQRYARMLAIVPPGTVIGDPSGEVQLSVDLSETGTPGGDRELERLEDLPAEGLVRIDHLEGVLDDAPSRSKGLGLFEKAVSRTAGNLRLVLFAHRDPWAVLDEEKARLEGADDTRAVRETLERWKELLGRFSAQWVSDAGDREGFDRELAEETEWDERALALLGRECRWSRPLQEIGRRLLRRSGLGALEANDLLVRIGQEAADHYRALWSALGADERHVLAQLACGCLVSRGLEEPLDHLLKWGLLTREPSTFQVMSESFRRFVAGRHDPEALRDWEAEGSVSVWRQVRAPFFAVLAVIGLFLLVTQRHLFNLAVAIASAGAAAVPGLMKLFGWIRQARTLGGE